MKIKDKSRLSYHPSTSRDTARAKARDDPCDRGRIKMEMVLRIFFLFLLRQDAALCPKRMNRCVEEDACISVDLFQESFSGKMCQFVYVEERCGRHKTNKRVLAHLTLKYYGCTFVLSYRYGRAYVCWIRNPTGKSSKLCNVIKHAWKKASC